MVRADSFSSPEAQRIARITYRQLDYWIRTELVRPSIGAKGPGTRRAFSFRDLVAVRAIAALKAAGVSLQAIRKVQRTLVAFEGRDDALRDGRLVLEQGRSKNPDVALALDKDAVMSLLLKPGQSVARVVFEMAPVYREVEEGVTKALEARDKASARKEKAA